MRGRPMVPPVAQGFAIKSQTASATPATAITGRAIVVEKLLGLSASTLATTSGPSVSVDEFVDVTEVVVIEGAVGDWVARIRFSQNTPSAFSGHGQYAMRERLKAQAVRWHGIKQRNRWGRCGFALP